MVDLPAKVYTTESQLRHPGHLFVEMIRDVSASKELAWRLTIRDISAQYRQTVLGILLAFILPLVNTVTWIFLNRSGVVTIEETALPYPFYVFTGTMLWAIFMDAVKAPLSVMTAAKQMLAKINFPTEALIISGIYQTLFNGLIKIMLMLVVMVIVGVYPGWQLLLFPFSVISLILAGTFIGVLLAPMGVLYKDVGNAIPLLMQFFMYISPVVFVVPKDGWASLVFKANPMTPLILTSRNWLTGSSTPLLLHYIWVNVVLLGLFFVVWIIFRVAIPILVERISA